MQKKLHRAVVKYKHSVDGAEKPTLANITVLVAEKTNDAVINKISTTNTTQKDIKVISIEWKNWWGKC